MLRAEDEALAAVTQPDGSHDIDAYMAEYQRRLAERQQRLRHEARASFRAMDGWGMVRSSEDWQDTVQKAADDLDRGGFLLDRLGAERHLDPELMAVLLVLRRRLIDEHGATTAADLMLIDVAVLSYYHTLRINGWIGNFAALIESEFFGTESLHAKLQDRYGRADHRINGLRVDDHVQRIGEQLLPLLDRCNRMMLRNLKALKTLREDPAPSVSIGNAGQVNVAGTQANAVIASTGSNATSPEASDRELDPIKRAREHDPRPRPGDLQT
jgi:hypothetical protein